MSRETVLITGASSGIGRELARRFAAESFGQWKVVYQRGAEIGGIVDAKRRDSAQRFVGDLLQDRLKLPPFKSRPGANAASGPPSKSADKDPEHEQ